MIFERLVIFILDLESTGVDVTKDRIVEIAAIPYRMELYLPWGGAAISDNTWSLSFL